VWRLTLSAGAETSMHCHPQKRTALLVESGSAILDTLNNRYPLNAGDMVHIERGAFHRTRTEFGVVLLEIETPPNKLDLVRLEDRYGRVGKGYEAA
jgi:mannose-6-phosphate isomerase-like protein (cupin superfamily)